MSTKNQTHNYSDMVSEESRKATAKAIKQDIYSKNMKAYYKQDSSDYQAVSQLKKSKAELDEKYSRYEQKYQQQD